MRKIIIAFVVAVAATFSFAAASQAAGVTVQFGDSGYYHHRDRYDHDRYDRDYRYRHTRHWRHHRRCHTERVIRYHHGRRYVEEYRVCRR